MWLHMTSSAKKSTSAGHIADVKVDLYVGLCSENRCEFLWRDIGALVSVAS